MRKIDLVELQKQTPNVPMAPLIDIIFLTLVFFMTMSVFAQMESEISISVPKAEFSKESMRSPGEIIINIKKDGTFIVNQNPLNQEGLETMLKKVSSLFPDQPVIVRADEETYHKNVIKVLDACARANIWDISFSTSSVKK
ncbi:MAG: biopolymer transporter ExbD [Candidatus Omnitrophica bacterium]|nr:biopolymer transporter ExbD [Candidatus Omnitrophota bacterium]